MHRDDALLALHLVPNLGPVRIRKLIAHHGSAENALRAREAEHRRIPGIGAELARSIALARESGAWETERAQLEALGGWILTENDPLYPRLLRQIFNAPVLLEVLGKLTLQDQDAFAIVGSRLATHYGNDCAKRFGYQLAAAGITVVSGLARGIDTAAHQGALAAKGRTVAVVGSGLARLYPPENQRLSEHIRESGAVVSEFPLEFPPSPQTFPYRNRIVAGMSKGLLVVEAGEKSGALITAALSLDQGRHVCAVPGPIDRPSSLGPNKLIQQGAKLVTCVEDILEELQECFPSSQIKNTAPTAARPQPTGLTPSESRLLSACEQEEQNFDSLVEDTGLEAREVTAALLSLELKQLIQALPGHWYRARGM